jgi:competence transcription factor ComK
MTQRPCGLAKQSIRSKNVEEIMVKVMMKEKLTFAISYKSLNSQLKKTKNALVKIKSKVEESEKKDIDLQIEAIDMFLSKCRAGKMTHLYHGRMTSKLCDWR